MKNDLVITIAFLTLSTVSAEAQLIGWPETVDRLAQERSQAQACSDLLKSSDDKAAILLGKIAYLNAKAASDGVIAGLTIALIEGYKPESLPRIQANLEKAGLGLQQVCSEAVKAAHGSQGSKGVVDEIVTASLGPVIDGLKSAAETVWAQHLQMDKLEKEAISGQLKEAKWPDF